MASLTATIQETTRAIESEKKQKQKAREQKQLEKLRQTRLTKTLSNYFEKSYANGDSLDNITYNLLKNKKLILDIIKNDYIKKYDIKKLDFNSSEYINNNYTKILNKIKKPYYDMAKIETKKQKEAEKITKNKNAQVKQQISTKWKVIEILIIILAIPFIITFGIIKGLTMKTR